MAGREGFVGRGKVLEKEKEKSLNWAGTSLDQYLELLQVL